MARRWRCGDQLTRGEGLEALSHSFAADGDDQAVAPAILGIHFGFDGGDERGIIGDAGLRGAAGLVAQVEANGGIGTQVLHPVGCFTLLGYDIVGAGIFDKPDFDFMRFAAAMSARGEIQEDFRACHGIR